MGESNIRIPVQHEGLGDIADVLSQGLGSRSKWALRVASEAARAEGIEGFLVIKIPSKLKDFAEVTFTVGTIDVVSRWGEVAR